MHLPKHDSSMKDIEALGILLLTLETPPCPPAPEDPAHVACQALLALTRAHRQPAKRANQDDICQPACAPEFRQVPPAHCQREAEVGLQGGGQAGCGELNALRHLSQQQPHQHQPLGHRDAESSGDGRSLHACACASGQQRQEHCGWDGKKVCHAPRMPVPACLPR